MRSKIANQAKKLIDKNKLYILIASIIILGMLPVIIREDYTRSIMIKILLYVMLASSLNIINGYTGQFNIGHAGLYAIGSYTAGILVTTFGWSFWILLPVSGMVTAIFGFLISIPTRKLAGIYLALVTLGFSEIIRLICLNWTELTGGPMGIKNIPRPIFFGATIKEPIQFYYIILVLAIVTILLMYRAIHSRIGRAWISIREDQTASRFLGVNINRLKSTNFAFGAFFAGVAGCFSAYYYQFISSDMFTLDEGFNILAMVIIGGQGTLIGPIIGSVIVNMITEVFRFVSEYRLITYAVLIIIMMWVRPQGLAGASDSVFATKRRKRSRRARLHRRRLTE